jgi:branched-chain amino acid transport system permease protein
MTDFLQQIINGLMIGGLYALVALGISLVFGLTGMINFAHGEIVMLGGYTTFMLTQQYGLPFPVSIACVLLAGAILGLLLDRTTFRFTRQEPMNGLVISLGLIMVFQSLVMTAWGTEPYTMDLIYPGAFQFFGLSLSYQKALTVAVTVVLIAAFGVFLVTTRPGRALRALAQEQEAAVYVGIPVERYIALSMAIGTGLATVAGALFSALFSLTPFVGTALTAKGFIVVALGGLGSATGTIVGGIVLGVVEALGAGYLSPAFTEAYGLLMFLAVLILRPQGMFGVSERVKL